VVGIDAAGLPDEAAVVGIDAAGLPEDAAVVGIDSAGLLREAAGLEAGALVVVLVAQLLGADTKPLGIEPKGVMGDASMLLDASAGQTNSDHRAINNSIGLKVCNIDSQIKNTCNGQNNKIFVYIVFISTLADYHIRIVFCCCVSGSREYPFFARTPIP